VIIATLGREAELSVTLKTLCEGNTIPDEVVIVDGDPFEGARRIVEQYRKDYKGIIITYINTKPGLPGQRNAGLERATGDIVLFIDDDVELDGDFISELTAVYRNPEIGGATGFIVNQVPVPGGLALLQRIFLFSRYAGRCYQQRSGLPTFLYKPERVTEVGILNGCNMSFRYKALEGFTFDSDINYFDDDDVSLTIGSRWHLVQVPTAKLKHVVSPKGRPRAPAAAARSVMEQRLLHKKHVRQTPFNIVAYYWSVIGAALVALVRMHPLVCLRTLLGLMVVLAGEGKRF
jgi:glycosyltransferase involved in cell wall biosynthesis